MNTPKIAALILGVGVASAGVTFFLSSNDEPAPTPAPAPPAASKSDNAPESLVARANQSQAPQDGERSSQERGPGDDNAEETPAPAGIDQDAWNDSQRRMRWIFGMTQSLKDPDGRWQQRMKDRVNRDSESIATALNLEGESAAQVQKLLESRMNGSLENSIKIMDSLAAKESSMVEYSALNEMAERGTELTAEQVARVEQLKNEIFGEFYTDGKEIAEDPLRDLIWRNPSNGDWYEDDAFLVKAAAEMPESEGAALLDQANKLNYLDRKEYATERVINIQRTVNLSAEQTQALNNLYIENRTPTDEQLSQIVSPDQVEAVKNAASSRDRRWRGRGRR